MSAYIAPLKDVWGRRTTDLSRLLIDNSASVSAELLREAFPRLDYAPYPLCFMRRARPATVPIARHTRRLPVTSPTTAPMPAPMATGFDLTTRFSRFVFIPCLGHVGYAEDQFGYAPASRWCHSGRWHGRSTRSLSPLFDLVQRHNLDCVFCKESEVKWPFPPLFAWISPLQRVFFRPHT